MGVPEANRILVVDDEASLRYFLTEELEEQGYQVTGAATGLEALAQLKQQAVDLAIVDLQMPGLNGLELMAQMQALPDPPAVIMLTAHATLQVSIEAMRRGCSDFLLKPYDVDELLQAVQRVLAGRSQKLQQRQAAHLLAQSLGVREGDQPLPAPDIIGDAGPVSTGLGLPGLSLAVETMTVSKDGRVLNLTPTEFRLLVILLKRPNVPHTFQALAEVVHNQPVDALQARDLLKSHLARLRQKLGQAPDGSDYIVNVRGVGYKIVSAS